MRFNKFTELFEPLVPIRGLLLRIIRAWSIVILLDFIMILVVLRGLFELLIFIMYFYLVSFVSDS